MLPKPLKYGAIAGGAALFGLMFGWVMFPALLKHMLKKEMALSKKTDVRKMWEVIPFPFDFKVYLFNYTNPEEVQNGAVPIVKEVGPYYFELWKVKVEIEDNNENDTATFKKKDTYIFKPELNGAGLTGEETIVIPHPLILSTMIVVNRTNAAMMPMISKGLKGIFDNPADVFMRVKPLDLLFRGVVIDCARADFAPKAVCTAYKKDNIPVFQQEPNSQVRFSFFGKGNATINPQMFTVKRGIKNVLEVGTLVSIDGKSKLKYWRDSCNNISGTDGTVFPPFRNEHERIMSFEDPVCRPFKPWFQKKTKYSGIKTNRYAVNIGDLANDPELNCYCDAPDNCPPKGLMDLMNCLQAPMYLSLPHFLDCDPSVLNNVKGLNPNVEEHGMVFDFEPISGTPMYVKKRIQFNIQLMKTSKYNILKNLPDTIAPLLWIEEGVALNKTFVKMLKMQLFVPKRIVKVFSWILVSFGTIGAIVGIVLHFKDDIMRLATSGDTNKVTTVKPEEKEKGISVIGKEQEPAKVDM